MRKPLMRVGFVLGVTALMFASGCGDGEPATEERPSRKRLGQIVEVKPSRQTKNSKVGKVKMKLTKKERRELKKKMMLARAEAIRKALETPPDDLSAADKKTFIGLRQAMDREDYREVRRYAEEAKNSPSAALRSEAVRALGWFGEKGLVSLTGFLSDADSDVAQEAQNVWESALMEIEDDGVKLQYLETAMTGIEDELMLDALAQNFNQVSDEAAAVETMARVIGKGGIGAEKTKEAYEFMTGEDWVDASEANRWVQTKRAEQIAEGSDEPSAADVE